MSRRKAKITERDLQGFKYFKQISYLLESLHGAACARDRAGNRDLHMDQYLILLLLCMFSPICSSLRAMQQASLLPKVQRKLRVPRAALGSLSEAARVFDSDLLLPLLEQLVQDVRPHAHGRGLEEVRAIITLVDGTCLTALPQAVQALWSTEKPQAFKAHVHYELLKGVPVSSLLTDARTSEISVLTGRLEAGRLYVLDRGYAKYQLLQDILDAGSGFVCRIKQHFHVTTVQTRPLTTPGRQAGILRDEIVALGHHSAYRKLQQPVRLLTVKCTERTAKSVRLMRQRDVKEETMWVVTNRLDLPAEVIALIYRYRWQIEIFFRFFKHVLGCRHLLSHCANGIELQTYAAIIACLLIALYTGRKPTLRTYEMFCWYLMGWADADDLKVHIEKLAPQT